MKKTSTHVALLATQMITVGLLIQGCRTYQPGGRSIFGEPNPGPTPVEKDTVTTIRGEKDPTGTDTVKPTPVVIPANQVGTPGTYSEFVVSQEAKDPHAGLTKLSTRHVPAPPPSAKPAPTASSTASSVTPDGKYKLYRVKRGDTAGVIANSNGMRLADFLALNNIQSPNMIRVGQQFKVPVDGKPLAPGRAPVASAAGSDANTYTVASGDSLSVIARRFGMRTADLMALNGITDANKIRIGQKLIVKGSAKTSTTKAPAVSKKADTATKKPDTVKSEKPKEEKPKAPEAAPREDEAGSDTIDQLLGSGSTATSTPVKDTAEVKPVAPKVEATPAAASDGVREHVVREGEDVYAIALHYKVRPVDIRSLNNLSGNHPTAGTVLKIPAAAE